MVNLGLLIFVFGIGGYFYLLNQRDTWVKRLASLIVAVFGLAFSSMIDHTGKALIADLSMFFMLSCIVSFVMILKNEKTKKKLYIPAIIGLFIVSFLSFGVNSAPQVESTDSDSNSEKQIEASSITISSSEKEHLKKEQEEQEKIKADEEAREKEEKIKADEEAAKNNPDTYRTGITYDQLARTPDDYMFKKVAFSGEIIQVIEDDDSTKYRLAVDGNYDTVMLIEISNDKLSTRILENDLVSIYGLSMGTISYNSTMGGKITIPGVLVNLFTIDGQG
ncbi:hypothetical protein [Enterococcus italicus]|uniref:hypothetical protein n=1 Tax=Enterococcus italicus TaxID=246144 RepID=UPI003F4805D3